MTNSRNLGLNHGQNGKGDADRTTNTPAYRKNIAGIDWGVVEPEGFVRKGRKLVKTYGATATSPVLFTGILRAYIPDDDERRMCPILYKRGAK